MKRHRYCYLKTTSLRQRLFPPCYRDILARYDPEYRAVLDCVEGNSGSE